MQPEKTWKNRGEGCQHWETPVFPEDPEHCELEGADDMDTKADAHK